MDYCAGEAEVDVRVGPEFADAPTSPRAAASRTGCAPSRTTPVR
ncbi:hypothetical protein SHL15_8936 [Streptomyces hygroscopicus subsp. limoneus]|nr:hypothetical protein SHL15_8936 [Streptomyces hygroscopicus subsp. limoneus]